MKKCLRCNKFKLIDEFSKNISKKDGLNSECKLCKNEYSKEYRKRNKKQIQDYNKRYHIDNYEEMKEHKCEIGNKYRKSNKEKIKKCKKRYYENNKEKILDKNNKYRLSNKDKRNKNHKKRFKIDISYRIQINIRTCVSKVFKRKNKIHSISKSLGCSTSFLKQHLESKFQFGMSWENYGSKWHIDHIIPLTAFNLQDIIHFRAACNYKNLQPLWAKDNISKGNKFKEENFKNYLKLFEVNNG